MDYKPEKFLFDLNDFSDEAPLNEPEEKKEPVFSASDLNAAREESFKLGVHEATNKIRNEHEERSVQTLETVARQLNHLLDHEQRRESAKDIDTARLTLAIIKKLMPHFSKKYADEEIFALVRQALGERSEEPRIVISVHDSMLDTMKTKIDDIITAQGFQGQAIIIADENVKETDCRIEWADGGIEKDFDRLYKTIEQAFHNLLHRIDDIPRDASNAVNKTQTNEQPATSQETQIPNENSTTEPEA